MLVAVVHVGGEGPALDVLLRLRGVAGEPDAVTRASGCAIAGWRGLHPLTIRDGCGVEGDLSLDAAGKAEPWLAKSVARASGDFAAMLALAEGLSVTSGPAGGYRPIFVARRGPWTAASTRLRALLSMLDDAPPLDVDYIASSTIADYPLDETATPYTTVRRVPPGELWCLRPDHREHRTVALRAAAQDETGATDHDLALRLREVIAACVERATRGATGVAVMLSGGLDSSSVFASAEGLRRSGRLAVPLDAYSWEFETPDRGDDRPYRRAVERSFNKPTHRIAPEQAGPFVRRAMVLDASPCVDVPCALWLALDAAAKRGGTDRILTGVGGDNILEGEPRLFGDLLRRGRPWEALRSTISLQGAGGRSAWWRIRHFLVRPLGRRLVPDRLLKARMALRFRRTFDWMGPRFTGWLERRIALKPQPTVELDWTASERYANFVRMPILSWMALVRSQQEEATQCRRVDPLFDNELVRFAASLPPLRLLAGDFLRGLLRNSMVGSLPEEVRTRPGKAYMEPASAGMIASAGGFATFERLARVERLSDLGLVHPDRFRRHFNRLASQPLGPHWWSVWPALAVEEFLRQRDEGWQI
jgi:asparagine synthase (glutamine-hydrolysing)